MSTHRSPFNHYFLLSLLFSLILSLAACKTAEERERAKERTRIQLFMETGPTGAAKNNQVPIYRDNPMMVSIDRAPFLDTGDIQEASVIDFRGIPEIRLQFTRHGSWVLEQMTTLHKGSRIVVFAQFPEGRWLAAPRIDERITSGTLSFTPDASPEEMKRIVNGLNNMVKEVKDDSLF